MTGMIVTTIMQNELVNFNRQSQTWSSNIQSGGSNAGLTPLVEFYSKLPKGPAPASASSGLRARYFEGARASPKPLVATIVGIFLLGYTIDYNSASFLKLSSLFVS